MIIVHKHSLELGGTATGTASVIQSAIHERSVIQSSV